MRLTEEQEREFKELLTKIDHHKAIFKSYHEKLPATIDSIGQIEALESETRRQADAISQAYTFYKYAPLFQLLAPEQKEKLEKSYSELREKRTLILDAYSNKSLDFIRSTYSTHTLELKKELKEFRGDKTAFTTKELKQKVETLLENRNAFSKRLGSKLSTFGDYLKNESTQAAVAFSELETAYQDRIESRKVDEQKEQFEGLLTEIGRHKVSFKSQRDKLAKLHSIEECKSLETEIREAALIISQVFHAYRVESSSFPVEPKQKVRIEASYNELRTERDLTYAAYASKALELKEGLKNLQQDGKKSYPAQALKTADEERVDQIKKYKENTDNFLTAMRLQIDSVKMEISSPSPQIRESLPRALEKIEALMELIRSLKTGAEYKRNDFDAAFKAIQATCSKLVSHGAWREIVGACETVCRQTVEIYKPEPTSSPSRGGLFSSSSSSSSSSYGSASSTPSYGNPGS